MRRALLLANRAGNGPIAITGQRAALGNASALGSAAASPNLKPAIQTSLYENNIVTSPYADCEFHDMTLTQKFFESAVRWPDKIALVRRFLHFYRNAHNVTVGNIKRFESLSNIPDVFVHRNVAFPDVGTHTIQ